MDNIQVNCGTFTFMSDKKHTMESLSWCCTIKLFGMNNLQNIDKTYPFFPFPFKEKQPYISFPSNLKVEPHKEKIVHKFTKVVLEVHKGST